MVEMLRRRPAEPVDSAGWLGEANLARVMRWRRQNGGRALQFPSRQVARETEETAKGGAKNWTYTTGGLKYTTPAKKNQGRAVLRNPRRTIFLPGPVKQRLLFRTGRFVGSARDTLTKWCLLLPPLAEPHQPKAHVTILLIYLISFLSKILDWYM